MNEAQSIKLQKDRLVSGMQALGLDVSRAELVMTYLLLLAKWNRTYNLTAVDHLPDMVTHHALDALAVVEHMGSGRLLDVGTGAGIPGFLIAIMDPERPVVLLDAVGKKARFMRQAKRELGLSAVTVVHERVENYFPDEKFDVVTSRAFSAVNLFLQLTAHLGQPGCRYLAMKGPKVESLDPSLPFTQTAQWDIQVPLWDVARKLYQYEKNDE